MELILASNPDARIDVFCDGQHSHSFDLKPLLVLPGQGIARLLPDASSYGQALYSALFAPDTLAHRTLTSAPTRIVLVTGTAELDALPWEYLAGPEGLLIEQYPFVRSIPVAQRQLAPQGNAPLHIVAVPANPVSPQLPEWPFDTAWLPLKESILALPMAMTLERTRPPTMQQLRNTVAGQQQCIVHLIGQGTQGPDGPLLCFEKEHGARDVVDAQECARQLRATTLLVILDTYTSATPKLTPFGELAATLVRQQIPYALALRIPLQEQDARLFTRTLYEQLARGIAIENALMQVRRTLAQEGSRPWVAGFLALYTSLQTPALGLQSQAGTPLIVEHQPPLQIDTLPQVEDTLLGRSEEVRRLGLLLTGKVRPPLVTIYGSAGIGKTALAREVIERFAFAWPGGVWATSLATLPDRQRLLGELAHFLGLRPQTIADPAEIGRQVKAHLAQQRTLLVLDHAETLIEAVEAQQPEALHLSQMLQQLPGPATSLLVTASRPLQWVHESALHLTDLAAHKAAVLFEHCAHRPHTAEDRSITERIVGRLAGNPLSMQLVGKAFDPSTYPSRLDLLRACEQQLRQTAGVGEYTQQALHASIAIAMQNLESEQRKLLRGLCIFRTPFLAETAAVLFAPQIQKIVEGEALLSSQLQPLCQQGLLRQETITSGETTISLYHLHAAVRASIEQAIPLSSPEEELLSRFSSAYAHIARFCWQERSSPIASLLMQRVKGDIERGLTFAKEARATYTVHWAGILHLLGSTQESLVLLEEILRTEQTEQAVRLLALNTLISVCHTLGQEQRAASLLEQVLALYQEQGDQAGEARTLMGMGNLSVAVQDWEQALHWYQQALALSQVMGEQASAAQIHTRMANTLRTLRRYTPALHSYEQALALYRALEQESNEATTLHYVGEIYRLTDQREQALQYYSQAYDLLMKLGNRRGVAMMLSNMATMHDVREESEQVLPLMHQALAIIRAVGDTGTEGHILNNIGEVYRSIDQPKQALPYLEEALLIARTTADQQNEAITLNNLALVHRALGHAEETDKLFEQSISLSHALHDYLGEAQALSNRAEAYVDVNQIEQAVPLYERALSLRRELGQRPQEAELLMEMGQAYYQVENPSQSLGCYEQALLLWQALGDRSQEAEALAAMGRNYRQLGQAERALRLYDQALPMMRELGNRAGEGTCLNGMAVAYQHLERFEQALETYQQALTLMREAGRKGAEANTLSNMAIVLHGYLHRTLEAIAYMEEAITVMSSTKLTQTAGGHTVAELERLLGMMQRGEPFFPEDRTEGTLSLETKQEYIRGTVLMITIQIQDCAQWHAILSTNLKQVQRIGTHWQTEADFLAALLALIDHSTLTLPDDHPYFALMHASITAEMPTVQKLVLAHRRNGKLAEALSAYERALPLYRTLEDAVGEATTLDAMGEVCRAQGNLERALDFYQQALPLYQSAGAFAGEAITQRNRAGLLYLYLDHPREAIAILEGYLHTLDAPERTGAIGHELIAELHQLCQAMSAGAYLLSEQSTISIFPAELVDEARLQTIDEHAALVLNRLADFYYKQKKYTQAEPLLQRCVAYCEQLFGPAHAQTLGCLDYLAKLYKKLGKYTEAEAIYRQILTLQEEHAGSDHLDTAMSLNDLALHYQAQSKYAEAEPLYQRALAIRETHLGAEHPDTATSLNNLAYLYEAQGRYTEAEPLAQRALAIREKHLGADHPDTAVSLNNLALLDGRLGRYTEAEVLLTRALAIWEQTGDTALISSGLNNLAEWYRELGRYTEAEPPYKRAFALTEAQEGSNSLKMAGILNNMAELYKRQGRYEEAEPLLQQALAICEKLVGEYHTSTALSLSNLGGLYHRQNQYDAAEPLFKRSLAVYQQLLGENHSETARLLNGLGEIAFHRQEFDQAEVMLQRALAIYRQQFGENHPETARQFNNLAWFYHEQKKYSAAEPFYQKALAIWERQLGLTHPNVALVLNNLANFYEDQGNYEASEQLYQRALEICDNVLGREHPTTKTIHTNYASFVQRWSMSQVS